MDQRFRRSPLQIPRSGPAAAAILVALGLSAHAEEPLMQGMDVGEAAKTVARMVAPPAHGDKPWSDDLAALTGKDARSQQIAMGNLVRRGPVVLADLAVLAKDQDWLLRARVAQVAAAIGGGESAPLLLSLSHDADPRVREIATLGLGRCSGPGVYERLVEQSAAAESGVRQAAAQAMGSLGDVRALRSLSRAADECDDFTKRDMKSSFDRVAQRPEAVPEILHLIEQGRTTQRDTVLEACAQLHDPRLCPALVSLLTSNAGGAWTSYLATKALATNGDSRAWETLCHLAADAPQQDLRDAASESLRALTGYGGFGKAWSLWWRDNGPDAPRRMERDRLLADLHDPSRVIERTELVSFTPDELMPLVDSALTSGGWWPARAFAALQADDSARWMDPLVARARATDDPIARVAMIVFIDQLDGPGSQAALRTVAKDLESRIEAETRQAKDGGRMAADHGPERLALAAALRRRASKP